MDTAIAVAAILGALLVGAVSPGPSFVAVARTAIAASRADGLAAALGMGVGGVVFGVLALAGLQAFLAEIGWLYAGLKVIGGAYLLYLALRLWRGASAPIEVRPEEGGRRRSLWRSFALGLATQIANPKTAIVYAGVFAALLPAAPTAWVFLVLPLGIFANEAGWYAAVAYVFSSRHPRAAYLRSKPVIDRVAASVLGALGVRLILDGARPG